MNFKLICADVLQKVNALIGLAIITKVRSKGDLNWIITGIYLTTLPKTLIVGIPLLKATYGDEAERPTYGDEAERLLAPIVVLQSLIWCNLLLFLFELSTAKNASMIQSSSATRTRIKAKRTKAGNLYKIVKDC